MPPNTERVLTFEESLAEVITHSKGRGATINREEEYVPLLEAFGRVLAIDVRADRDQPPFARSTRDGFALYSGDPAWSNREFQIIGSVRAGERWTGANLGEGQAIEIMTGAPLPPGADAVLMVEHATVEGGTLRPEPGRALAPGQNVVQQGAEARDGQTVLPSGRRIGAAEISVAASVGQKFLAVVPKPRVAIVATGDELVELSDSWIESTQPEDWQIRNSNSYALAALVHAEGGIGERLPIARDTVDDLHDRVDRGRSADLLLLSGGVSMGKYDLVESVLTELSAEFIFTGALIQPGKPVVFGRLPAREHPRFGTPQPERYFFGLPGNPVSTQVCFHVFVAPFLRALAGHTDISPQFVEARLAEPVKGGAKVTRILPAELTGDWRGADVRVVAWQGSGDLAANARSNCYALFPAGVESFQEGQVVLVLLRL